MSRRVGGVSVAWLEDARTRVRERDAPSGQSDEKSVGFAKKRDVSRTSASLSLGNGTRHASPARSAGKKKTPSRVGSGVTHVFQLLHRPEGGGLPASPAPGGPRGGGAAAPRLLRAEQTLEHDLGSRKCHPRGVPCSPESRWRRPLPFPRARSRKNERNRVASTPSTTGVTSRVRAWPARSPLPGRDASARTSFRFRAGWHHSPALR